MSCRIKLIITPLIMLLPLCKALAQDNQNFPYTMFGIGEIENREFGRLEGMSSVGTAFRSSNYFSADNPASYTAMFPHAVMMDIEAGGKNAVYYSGNDKASGNDFSFKRLAFAFKPSKKVGLGLGLKPFSTVSYNFSDNKPIEGTTETVNTVYTGTGGLNQAYIAPAYELFKNFSVGVTASYLFGNINQTEAVQSDYLNTSVSGSRQTYISNFHFNFGLQYYGYINKKNELVFGASFSNQTSLKASYNEEFDNDTIPVVKSNDIINKDYFDMPLTYSAGLSWINNQHFILAGSYNFQQWGSLNYKGDNYQLVNSQRYAIGAQYAMGTVVGETIAERLVFQAGLSYSNSYLQINNQQVDDLSGTVGMVIPSKNNSFNINLSVEAGSRGSRQNNQIQENYTMFNVGITLKDAWFFKKKYY